MSSTGELHGVDGSSQPNLSKDQTNPPPATGSVKRKRGRPPKYKGVEPPRESTPPVRKRGRPSKKRSIPDTDEGWESEEEGGGEGGGGKVKRGDDDSTYDQITSEFFIDQLSPVRYSNRLAKKREAGYVAPWIRGAKESQEEESESEEPPTQPGGSDESNITPKNAVKGKRGRPRKVKVEEKREEEMKVLQDALKKQEVSLKEVTDEEANVFDQAAAKITKLLPGSRDQVERTMDSIAHQAQLSGYEIKEDAIFIFGSLEALINSRELINQACAAADEAETVESEVMESETGVQEVQDPGPTDPEVQDAEAGDPEFQGPEILNPEDGGENSGAEKEKEEENHVAAQPVEELQTETDGGVVDPDVPLVNPTTNKPYNRLSAVFKNRGKATSVCRICKFITTERGMHKHMVRQHPDTVFECEICLRKFGVRYDMRRHRITHFDSAGVLKPRFEPFFRKRFPVITGKITLSLLEQDFVLPSINTHEGAVTPGAVGEGQEGKEEPMGLRREESMGEGRENEGGMSENEGENVGEINEEIKATMEDVEEEEQDTAIEEEEKDETEEEEHVKKREISTDDDVEESEDENNKIKSDAPRLSELLLCEICDFAAPKQVMLRHKLETHPLYLFKCPNCDLEVPDFSSMVKHYATHFDVAPENVDRSAFRPSITVICTGCGKEDTENKIKAHILESHIPSHTCRHCDRNMYSHTLLQKHFRECHAHLYNIQTQSGTVGGGDGPVRGPGKSKRGRKPKDKGSGKVLKLPPDVGRQICEVCGVSVRLAWYHQHMKTHKRAQLTCDQCDFTTELKFKMKNHKLTKHGPKRFACEVCNQEFAFKQTYRTHMKTRHSETPESFQCEHCSKTFKVRRFLTTHIKRMHLKEKKYFCDVCNRGFFEQIRMKQHREVHLPQLAKEALKQYQCKYCLVRFRDQVRLSQHENIHTGSTPYQCKHCDKAFRWNSELSKHVTSKHKEESRYQCETCHKAFKFRYKLTSHMIVHTQEKKHYCEICNKVFTSLTTLRKHRCRILTIAEAQSGMTNTSINTGPVTGGGDANNVYMHVTNIANMDASETAVMSSEDLAQFQEAVDGACDGSVTFMCGICHSLFSTAHDINKHVFQAHEDPATSGGSGGNTGGNPGDTGGSNTGGNEQEGVIEISPQGNTSTAVMGEGRVEENVNEIVQSAETVSVTVDQNMEETSKEIGEYGEGRGEEGVGGEEGYVESVQYEGVGGEGMTYHVVSIPREGGGGEGMGGENIQMVHIQNKGGMEYNNVPDQIIINGEIHQVVHNQPEEGVGGEEVQWGEGGKEEGQIMAGTTGVPRRGESLIQKQIPGLGEVNIVVENAGENLTTQEILGEDGVVQIVSGGDGVLGYEQGVEVVQIIEGVEGEEGGGQVEVLETVDGQRVEEQILVIQEAAEGDMVG